MRSTSLIARWRVRHPGIQIGPSSAVSAVVTALTHLDGQVVVTWSSDKDWSIKKPVTS
jgi:hypothetical protein